MKRILSRPLVLSLCLLLSLPAAADAASELPSGFIAMSDSTMDWVDAQAFCRQKGGRLPRINDSDSFAWTDRDKITLIDAFGAPGAPWPSDLPGDSLYWTGTVRPDFPGLSWLVGVCDSKAYVNYLHQSTERRVVCVP